MAIQNITGILSANPFFKATKGSSILMSIRLKSEDGRTIPMNCFVDNTGRPHPWSAFKAGDAVEVEYYVDTCNDKPVNRVRNIKSAVKATETKPSVTMPVGVLVYVHEELTERVPFMSENAMFDAFRTALESGFPIEHLWPYVSEGHMDLVDRMFLCMDRTVNERYSIYQLNRNNLESVLGDHVMTVGPAA